MLTTNTTKSPVCRSVHLYMCSDDHEWTLSCPCIIIWIPSINYHNDHSHAINTKHNHVDCASDVWMRERYHRYQRSITPIFPTPPLPSHIHPSVLLSAWGILIKRLHFVRRDWQGLIWTILMPIVLVALAIGFSQLGQLDPENQRQLTPAMFNPNSYAFFR